MERFARHFAALTLTLLASAAVAQAPPRVRLNINDPAFDVALYERAIDILKARDPAKDSKTDPTYNSYKYFQELHNGPEGKRNSTCDHQNEIFVTWHRALLYLFERALQESDPPATRSLMLPFWNWTEEHTFPPPFTNPASTLSKDRLGNAIVRNPGGDGETYTTAQLLTRIRTSKTWRDWAGGACEPGCVVSRRCVSQPCTGEPCAKCDPVYGQFESPFHNMMHLWVGGPMYNDDTAAIDPLFWSYHAYIDLLHTCWQKTWNDNTPGCPDCPFVGMKGWTPSRVATTEALGYTYDFRKTPCAPPELVPAAAVMEAHAHDAAADEPQFVPRSTQRLTTAERSAAQPLQLDVTIPAAEFTTANIRIEGLEVFPDYNYTGSIFLYPATASFAPGDAAFRRQYLIERLAVWGTHGHDDEGDGTAAHEVTYVADATTELRYLAKTQPGTKWRIGIVIDPPRPQTTSERPNASAEVARSITFDRVSLVYDREWQEDNDDEPR